MTALSLAGILIGTGTSDTNAPEVSWQLLQSREY